MNYYRNPSDPSQFSVADNVNHEWRGVITQTEDGKWRSGKGKVFGTARGSGQ